MKYNPQKVKRAYNKVADFEDKCEKELSLRTEIPRVFIRRYIKKSDTVLDAGGGTGINTIMMARFCRKVTLLDITPKILQLAEKNIKKARLQNKINIIEGDITDLRQFESSSFSFVVCVGDAISYVLNKRKKALSELVRVAQKGAYLIIGCDSKYGFMGDFLRQGKLKEALSINRFSECYDGMGSRTHLYTVSEMTRLLEKGGCDILEMASTPTLAETVDPGLYQKRSEWKRLKKLELELCTRPELLGIGDHLLFVVRKKGKPGE